MVWLLNTSLAIIVSPTEHFEGDATRISGKTRLVLLFGGGFWHLSYVSGTIAGLINVESYWSIAW